MKRTHELKCWPEPWQALADGTKTFEFRRDDRGYMVGDVLDLALWDPGRYFAVKSSSGTYINRFDCPCLDREDALRLRFEVTYILHGGRFGVPEGYCVMGIRRLGDD